MAAIIAANRFIIHPFRPFGVKLFILSIQWREIQIFSDYLFIVFHLPNPLHQFHDDRYYITGKSLSQSRPG